MLPNLLQKNNFLGRTRTHIFELLGEPDAGWSFSKKTSTSSVQYRINPPARTEWFLDLRLDFKDTVVAVYLNQLPESDSD